MTRKGGFLKGIVASAATYAVKTAVDIAVNPENMQKVAQLVSEQQVGSKLKQAATNMGLKHNTEAAELRMQLVEEHS